ncbi:TPR repeat-containing protein YrrB [Fundidesulfovibrio magnetotacticus]|uniref:TPR repeat-containing protein YrrB n=1 Tax=Fundidesulfovibrio magnetotacticus TaxID=2730080 RepID=A0A6V8LPV1_9BACT|nr:tetratricopeptide repeat protein [Fundidesulfovibrio magnetotacticus]GFK93744.1 TPR repeat-containing protein YrrB [Fundidesulfovibrio magnetotacticus]
MSGHLDYEINKELGECYLFMGDLDKAEEYYRKAMNSNGIHPDPYMGLATIAVHRGDLDAAFGFYRKAANVEATDKSLSGMALIEMERGEHEAAFGHFAQALDHNPENMVALYSLIRLGHAMDRVDEVVPHLEDCLAVDPLKHDIRYSLAGCLITAGRPEEAREHLERILQQEPSYARAVELKEHLEAQAA